MNKVEMCRELFDESKSRKENIATFIEKASCTAAGASTYYAQIKKERSGPALTTSGGGRTRARAARTRNSVRTGASAYYAQIASSAFPDPKSVEVSLTEALAEDGDWSEGDDVAAVLAALTEE